LIKGEPPSFESTKGIENMELINYNFYNLFKFTITADDLPPEIVGQHLPPDYSDYSFYYDRHGMYGSTYVLIGFSLALLLYQFGNVQEGLSLFQSQDFFTDFSFLKLSILICWLLAVILVIIGTILQGGNIKPKQKLNFKVPKNLNRYY